jgi:hypothetical protein
LGGVAERGDIGLIKRRELTTREFAARRRNARKSTGPRTASGKARVTLNALKHAERSRSMIRFLRLLGIRPYVFLNHCRDLRAPGEIMEAMLLSFFRRWLARERHRLTGRKREWALNKNQTCGGKSTRSGERKSASAPPRLPIYFQGWPVEVPTVAAGPTKPSGATGSV